jgi:hypothetical protein
MKDLKHFYEKIVWAGDTFKHLFLLIIRLYWGVMFGLAGWRKFINCLGRVFWRMGSRDRFSFEVDEPSTHLHHDGGLFDC